MKGFKGRRAGGASTMSGNDSPAKTAKVTPQKRRSTAGKGSAAKSNVSPSSTDTSLEFEQEQELEGLKALPLPREPTPKRKATVDKEGAYVEDDSEDKTSHEAKKVKLEESDGSAYGLPTIEEDIC